MPKVVHKKKKFIDPRVDNCTTFTLVHRSQKDPLATDDTAPQRVLVANPEAKGAKKKTDREEERQFGVFYDDDYNYLQHLVTKEDFLAEQDFSEMEQFLNESKKNKDANGRQQEEQDFEDAEEEEEEGREKQRKVPLLPSSVFASRFEETVGVLNRAAPRSGPLLDWDPDIVETLDDDFKHEAVYTLKDEEAGGGEFDDFLAQALGDVGGEGGDEEEEGEGDYDSDFGGAGSDYEADKDDAFETKSRFTEYSMSSSVVPRTEHMQRLDDQLEEFIDEYREDNIGSLEFDDIEGHKEPSPATVRQFVVEFKKQRELDRQKPEFQMAVIPEEYHYVVDEEEGEEEDEDKPMEPIIFEKEDRWDCESILSTYSNIYNHPKLIEVASIKKQIEPILISGKTGMPKDIFGKGLTANALKQLDFSNGGDNYRNEETATLASRVSAISIRPPHETTDEKRDRKAAVKELRKERRVEKKVNKTAFREEQNRQIKHAANQGNSIGKRVT